MKTTKASKRIENITSRIHVKLHHRNHVIGIRIIDLKIRKGRCAKGHGNAVFLNTATAVDGNLRPIGENIHICTSCVTFKHEEISCAEGNAVVRLIKSVIGAGTVGGLNQAYLSAYRFLRQASVYYPSEPCQAHCPGVWI